jgi:hypothetical protein
MTISLPLEQWPLVICGPMLRRVTPTSVAVFVALKSACKVTLSIHDSFQSDSPVIKNHSEETIAFGKNLHIRVIEVSFDSHESLISGKVYGYNLILREAPGGSPGKSLSDLGMLNGSFSLVYVDGQLPSFSLPPGLKDLNIFHGSCRKPHAPGYDALAILDDVIRANYQDPLKRPHQLLFTGDQIYADDVALVLLKILMKTSEDILSWNYKESIQIPSQGGTTSYPSDSLAIEPGPKRKKFIKQFMKITSQIDGVPTRKLYRPKDLTADSHLLFLGEFYLMYLLSWSIALWPKSTDNSITLPSPEEIFPSSDASRSWLIEEFFKEIRYQSQQILLFVKTLPKVARVLANIPTYMIFDDHEVTDDWFLHRLWDKNARDNLPTQRVMRNGLLAYAIFQDWGNRPDYYRSGFGKQLIDALTYQSAKGIPPIVETADLCDLILDIQPTNKRRPLLKQRLRWDYVVSGKEHIIIALDSRTCRFYPNGDKDAAGLISSKALDEQLDIRKPADSRLVLIIAPAPVFGHPFVEEGQKFLVRRGEKSKEEKLDNEPWGANRVTFEDFLQRLAKFKRAIILSGDVHYAFSNYVAYFPDKVLPSEHARFIQLCSSALKNEEMKTRLLGDLGYLRRDDIYRNMLTTGWLGFKDNLEAVSSEIKKALMSEVRNIHGTDPKSFEEFLSELIFDVFVEGRFSAPAVLPKGPWVYESPFQIIKACANDIITGQSKTDWRYSITYLTDPRITHERLRHFPTDIQESLEETGDSRAYRAVVGTNNIGQIQFDTNQQNVIHRLHWYAPIYNSPKLDYVVMLTEHIAPLTQPTINERPEVIK